MSRKVLGLLCLAHNLLKLDSVVFLKSVIEINIIQSMDLRHIKLGHIKIRHMKWVGIGESFSKIFPKYCVCGTF